MENSGLRTRALKSLIFLLAAHSSVAATGGSHDFVLARIQPGWVAHFVAAEGDAQKHICGIIERKILRAESVALRLAPLPANRRSVGGISCPKDSEVADAEIRNENLLAVDILYSDADIYTIPGNRPLTFRHPVKKDTAAFEGDEIPPMYEMRVKSPVLLPGRYLPEISLAAGYAGFFGISAVAPQLQLSTLWFMHPRFANWFIRADASYWTKSASNQADFVFPDRMVTTALGLSWRFLNYSRVTAHTSLSAVSVFYRYFDEDFQWAHRGALRAAVSIDWAFRHANIDLHKAAIFVEPQYTQFFNKSSGASDWTRQWAVLLGVRYVY